jgi:hypothetical protein
MCGLNRRSGRRSGEVPQINRSEMDHFWQRGRRHFESNNRSSVRMFNYAVFADGHRRCQLQAETHLSPSACPKGYRRYFQVNLKSAKVAPVCKNPVFIIFNIMYTTFANYGCHDNTVRCITASSKVQMSRLMLPRSRRGKAWELKEAQLRRHSFGTINRASKEAEAVYVRPGVIGCDQGMEKGLDVILQSGIRGASQDVEGSLHSGSLAVSLDK